MTAHRYFPCPQGCGNQIRKRGGETPEMCRNCRNKVRAANKVPDRLPCPKGCGRTVLNKGPHHTPAMCRKCWDAERMREADGRWRARERARMEARNPANVDLLAAPMNHLWFETSKVFDYIEANVGSTVRLELSKHGSLAGRWDAWRGRPWLRFDSVDEVMCVLGLWVGDLGDPIWSGSEKRYPVLEAA